FYAYLLAAIPLLGAIIEAVVSESYSAAPARGVVFFAYFLVCTLVVSLDTITVKRSCAKSPVFFWWLVAAYPLQRAARLGQRRTYFWVWVVCVALSVAIDQPAVKGAMYLGLSDLPPCSSSAATNLVSDIFSNSIPFNKFAGIKAVAVNDIEDLGTKDGK